MIVLDSLALFQEQTKALETTEDSDLALDSGFWLGISTSIILGKGSLG